MRTPQSQPKTNALNIKEPINRKNEIRDIANVMSEQVKMPNRHFLGANTPITAKDKCFKYKGANKQKKRNPGYSKCNVRASKNAEQAFSRCEYPNHSQKQML